MYSVIKRVSDKTPGDFDYREIMEMLRKLHPDAIPCYNMWESVLFSL